MRFLIILPTDDVNTGRNSIVSHFMKGIYKRNPPMPCYHTYEREELERQAERELGT